MSATEILITLHSGSKEFVHSYIEKSLLESGYGLNAVYREGPLDQDRLCEAIRNASGYIVGLEKVTEEVLNAAKKLKVISKFGVGTDNIDIAAAEAKGVMVSNCPGSNSNAVAELALGLMISLARNTHHLCNDLRARHWSMDIGSELSTKRVAILGFGNVGRRLAAYLKPFHADILVYDAVIDSAAAEEYGVRYASLDEIATTSDFISVHLPLLPETAHLIDADFFAKVKPGVFVLNLARGGIIDENALYEAVLEGRVSRAATDVFEFEPPTASKLLDDDRFIVLPHIGAATRESTLNMMRMALDNVRSVLEGRGNPHQVRSGKAK
ncbi:MAG: phosphoglycerate dehydrogenase [Treponemataceae bacterium]